MPNTRSLAQQKRRECERQAKAAATRPASSALQSQPLLQIVQCCPLPNPFPTPPSMQHRTLHITPRPLIVPNIPTGQSVTDMLATPPPTQNQQHEIRQGE